MNNTRYPHKGWDYPIKISQLDPRPIDQPGSMVAMHHGLNEGKERVLLSGMASVDVPSPGWTKENTLTGSLKGKLSQESTRLADS